MNEPKRESFSPTPTTSTPTSSDAALAVVSFETQFAPFGGLASVLTKIAVHLALYWAGVVSIFTPYHWRISKTKQLKTALAGQVTIPFNDRSIEVKILRYQERHSIEGRPVMVDWYFLRATDEQFFAGAKHPYDLGTDETEINNNLFRDSLFFGAAVAKATEALFPFEQPSVLMHDWSALTTALALPPSRRSNLRACIHNGYDMQAADEELRRFGIQPQHCAGETILSRALPLVNGPILTVSQQFALDLRNDFFQAAVFTPHLQAIFAQKQLYGINHGPFVPLKFPAEFIGEVLNGNYQALAQWKAKAKREAVAALEKLVSSPATPVWGNVSKFVADPEAPWFIMGGRLDNRQKGFDTCAKAIAMLLETGDVRSRWLLLPMEGIEGAAGLCFLRRLADRFPDRVLVLPFIWKEGFATVSAAATFGLVTSYFEPGGLTSEFVANATVPVVRGTGGSLQQVVPWRASATMHQSILAKCDQWHAASAPPSGIVYDAARQDRAGWDYINAGGYNLTDGPDVVEHRERCPLFLDMASELALAMTEALRLYENQPALYYEMAANGAIHFVRNFSWQKNGREYKRMVAA